MTTYTVSTSAKLAFPKLIVAQASATFKRADGQPNTPRFEAVFLFSKHHPELLAISQEIQATVALRWPTGMPMDRTGQPAECSSPLLDGDIEHQLALQAKPTGRGKPWAQGYWVLPTKAYPPRAPRLAALVDGKAVEFAQAGDARFDARPYFRGGFDVRAEINFTCYPKATDPVGPMGYGVTAYVNSVAYIGTGAVDPALEAGDQRPATSLLEQRAHVGVVTQVNTRQGLPA